MNTINKELFEDSPVSKAVMSMAVPTIISMLVVVIYNMADTFFIGQTHDPMQVAAVSLATPVFMVFMAIGNLFGIGGTSAISRSLGEGNLKRAKNISSFCFYASIGIGILVCVLYWIFMDQLLLLIGASEATIGFARQYLVVVSAGAPFIMFSTTFGNILRGEGASKEAMVGNMIGTIANIILDPIFILVFHMGVTGAAIATVLGNAFASAFYLIYFLQKRSSLSIRLKDFVLTGSIVLDIFAIGFPASLNNILMSFSNIILNKALIGYGDIPVAAMGIASKANLLPVLLLIGLCAGIQPLIGYCYGAKNFTRLKQIMKFTALVSIIMGTILTIFLFFTKGYIVRAFLNDESVLDYGMQMVFALQISGPFLGLLFLFINVIQGMGKGVASLVLTLCRQGLFFIPAVYILDKLFQLDGIIYSQPAADYFAIFVAMGICMGILNKEAKKAQGSDVSEQ